MTSDSPVRFSVVIPLFNKRRFIRATLESVLAQDHPWFEVIVVDDGSTDGSVGEIEDLIGSSVRLVCQQNSGPGMARNRGFAEARYDWVALLDADDRWASHHLSTLAELIVGFSTADAVATSLARIPEFQEVPGADPKEAAAAALVNYFQDARTREVVSSSSIAIRRSAFQRTSGFGSFWPSEDSEFWARFALDHAIAASSRVTSYYTMGTSGITETGTMRGLDESEAAQTGLVGTLEKALAEPRYARIHPEISAYKDWLFLRVAKQELYRGHARNAQTYLRRIDKPGSEFILLRMLSLLPSRLLSAALNAYRTTRGMRRR